MQPLLKFSLGKNIGRAVEIGRQFVRGERLPISERRETGVLFAADFGHIGHQFRVERLRPRKQRIVIAPRRSQQRRRVVAVATPPGALLRG